MPCPVINSSHLLGKKWAIPIIEEIALGKFDGFNSFLNKFQGITPTRLSEQLKELETENIIQKTALNNPHLEPTKYVLTEKGHEFHRLIQEIKKWNVKWNEVPYTCLHASCTECERFRK